MKISDAQDSDAPTALGQQTAADFFRAGAVAIGVGRDLISPEAIRRRGKNWIRELAQCLLQIIAEARAPDASFI